MTLIERIEQLIEPALAHEGYGVVRIQITGMQRKVLQLMIERKDEVEITIDDCVRVSRYVSSLLDVDDPLPFAYTLEVSSPGLDRPLVKKDDFKRFCGQKIKLSLTEAIEKRKKFVAHLDHADDEKITVSINSDAGELVTFDIPHHQIQTAKLYVDFENFTVKGKAGGKSKN